MSLQYWGQPFVASGNYSGFKMVTNPLADKYHDRTHTYTPSEIAWDDASTTWMVDENRDLVTDYSFENPSFKWSEFKSNLVFRWEYSPGSAFYFVWSQFRDYSAESYSLTPASDMNDLFSKQPKNIWLLKFSYRFRA